MTNQELLINHFSKLSEDEFPRCWILLPLCCVKKNLHPNQPIRIVRHSQSSDTALNAKNNAFFAKTMDTHLCLLQIP